MTRDSLKEFGVYTYRGGLVMYIGNRRGWDIFSTKHGFTVISDIESLMPQ